MTDGAITQRRRATLPIEPREENDAPAKLPGTHQLRRERRCHDQKFHGSLAANFVAF